MEDEEFKDYSDYGKSAKRKKTKVLIKLKNLNKYKNNSLVSDK